MDYNLVEDIKFLFDNRDTFARLAASIDRTKLQTINFYFGDDEWPIELTFLCIDKNKVCNHKEAFCHLFISALHINYWWIYDEKDRTNADQSVIELIEETEWKEHLPAYIEHYFNLKYNRLKIQSVDIRSFIKDYLCWMPNPKKDPLAKKKRVIQEVNTTSQVITLFEKPYRQQYFGMSDTTYFFADSGFYL